MNPNQIFEDFDRKYQGSFVQVAFTGKQPELFQLRRIVNDNSKFPKLELQSDKLGTILLNYNTSARILFKVPQATYVQNGKDVVFFHRMAERQWKRGIHSNNVRFVNPRSNWELMSGGRAYLDFQLIREAFNPKFATLDEAIQLIDAKKYSGVALSRNMAIVKPGRRDTKVLFYRLAPIGTVDNNGNINAPDFETEIRNEIKRSM
jgi:hypothetical protein